MLAWTITLAIISLLAGLLGTEEVARVAATILQILVASVVVASFLWILFSHGVGRPGSDRGRDR